MSKSPRDGFSKVMPSVELAKSSIWRSHPPVQVPYQSSKLPLRVSEGGRMLGYPLSILVSQGWSCPNSGLPSYLTGEPRAMLRPSTGSVRSEMAAKFDVVLVLVLVLVLAAATAAVGVVDATAESNPTDQIRDRDSGGTIIY